MKTTSCLPVLALLGCLGSLTEACATDSDGSKSGTAADTNGKTVCSAEGQLAAYNGMITQPIVPPRMFAGVDIANGDNWTGLKLEDAEKTLCSSNPMAAIDGDTQNLQSGWGIAPNYQVVVQYDKTSHEINFWQLNPGYTGTLDFKSRATALGDATKPNPFGQHTYKIGVDTPILRDGQPWMLDWSNQGANIAAQATEIYDALMATFAPELPSTQGNCSAEELCLARPTDATNAVFGARALGIYFMINDITAPQPAPSSPAYFYGFPIKTLPFSNAAVTAKLDAEGPLATANGLGDRKESCTMKLGMGMGSFLDACVNVMNDAHTNTLIAEKALGGAQRIVTTGPNGTASATWDLDVNGTHPSFSSVRFDETQPANDAVINELRMDIRTTRINNEYSADGSSMTLAATSAIYAEYARSLQSLAQSTMDASLPRYAIGDAHCVMAADADAATWKPPAGCTGLEEMIIPSATNGLFGAVSVLKPGTPWAYFCADPGVYNHCGDQTCDDSGNNCVADKLGLNGSLFSSPQNQLTAVLGGGDAKKLPAALQSSNTYVTVFAKALVKYLRAATQSPTDLSAPTFDSLTPADSDITVVAGANNGDLVVKYQTHLEVQLNVTNGQISAIIFR